MAAYKQQYFTWIGHSVNDTAPAASTVSGHFKYDTDLTIMSYSDGTTWKPFAFGAEAIAELKNKTVDFVQNDFFRLPRHGYWSAEEQTGRGLLNGCVVIGVDGGVWQNTQGKYRIITTRNVVNDCCGIAKLDTFTCWRNSITTLRFAFNFLVAGVATQRMFKGVGAQRLINLDTNVTPLNSNESGFFFGHGAGDTNFKVWYNDGTGTCIKDDTGIPLPSIDTNYVLEIKLNNSTSSFTATLWNTFLGAKTTQAGSVIKTTRIPAFTTSLFLQDLLVTTNGTVRTVNIHWDEVIN